MQNSRILSLSKRMWDTYYESNSKYVESELDIYVKSDFNEVVINGFWRGVQQSPALEIGCGSAGFSFILAKMGAKVVGLDISKQALLQAKTRFLKRRHEGYFVQGDIRHLPFKNNTFKFIFGGGTIEHVEDTLEVVKEVARTLDKNGVFVATVPVVSLTTFTYCQLWGNIPDVPIIKQIAEFLHLKILNGQHMCYGYEKSFTPKKICKFFKNCGFCNIQIGRHEGPVELENIRNYIPKFICNKIIKFFQKLSYFRLFWPSIYVKGEKL